MAAAPRARGQPRGGPRDRPAAAPAPDRRHGGGRFHRPAGARRARPRPGRPARRACRRSRAGAGVQHVALWPGRDQPQAHRPEPGRAARPAVPVCDGAGTVPGLRWRAEELMRALSKLPRRRVAVLAAPDLHDYLNGAGRAAWQAFAARYGGRVALRIDQSLAPGSHRIEEQPPRSEDGGPEQRGPDGPRAARSAAGPRVHEYRPFCSARCRDVDLGRWFGEVYTVPARSRATTSRRTKRPAASPPEARAAAPPAGPRGQSQPRCGRRTDRGQLAQRWSAESLAGRAVEGLDYTAMPASRDPNGHDHRQPQLKARHEQDKPAVPGAGGSRPAEQPSTSPPQVPSRPTATRAACRA